ncbi:MAG: hypothetical protein WEA29_07120 [Acidimicrobiia bacterium]
MRASRRGLVALLAVVAAVGCSGEAGSPASSTPGVSPISSTPFDEITLGVDPGPDRGGAALKAEVFADGAVTFEEYERAMHAYAQCMRDEGFQVDGPVPMGPEVGAALSPGDDPRNFLLVTFPGIVSEAEDQRNSEADLRCQEQWSFAIEKVWAEQNAATGIELQEWLERAWDCARQRGTVLSDPPTELEATLSALDGMHDGCVPWE